MQQYKECFFAVLSTLHGGNSPCVVKVAMVLSTVARLAVGVVCLFAVSAVLREPLSACMGYSRAWPCNGCGHVPQIVPCF